MRELQKKELVLQKIKIKKEDQAMGPDSGIQIRTFPIELIPIMDKIIRTMDDRLTDDQFNSPTETMRTDRIMETTIIKGTWRNFGKFSCLPSGCGRIFSQGNLFR